MWMLRCGLGERAAWSTRGPWGSTLSCGGISLSPFLLMHRFDGSPLERHRVCPSVWFKHGVTDVRGSVRAQTGQYFVFQWTVTVHWGTGFGHVIDAQLLWHWTGWCCTISLHYPFMHVHFMIISQPPPCQRASRCVMNMCFKSWCLSF